jgi:hypothetical protein
MPASWEYRDGVVVVVAEGLDTPDEWEQALREAMADRRFRAGTRLLFDGRRGFSPLGSEDLERGLRIIAGAVAGGFSPRVGVLMRDTPREMLEALRGGEDAIAQSTGIRFAVFRDEADALAALQSAD